MTTNLYDIQQQLTAAGYTKLAGIVAGCIEKSERYDYLHVGVVGDDLVGKSTVINLLLGEKLLPETVIPSSAEILIKYGKNEVRNQNDEIVDDGELMRLIEEYDFVSISADNAFLKENSLEIKEFHGFLNKQKMNDVFWMSSIYKCDAMVLVMSAEHLLSESECGFIENYIQYVGENHLLLVINKLASVAECDIANVLEYAQKQIAAKFPAVKWAVNDPENKYGEIISQFTSVGVKDGIAALCSDSGNRDVYRNDKIIRFVHDELVNEMGNLRDKQGKHEDEIRLANQKMLEQKESEKTVIEKASIEFAQKRNASVEKIDSFIKEEFSKISDGLLEQYDNAADKYKWYSNDFETSWINSVSSLSERALDFIEGLITEDVDRLNDVLDTGLKCRDINIDIPDKQLSETNNITNYRTYRKYIPIGVGGGIVIGYCLLRVVGAAISIGGGMLAFSYLKFKENTQDEEIKRSICSQIRDISSEVRRLTRKDIEDIYDDILAEFRNESDGILDSRFRVVDEDTEKLADKINEIQSIIAKTEV